MGVGLLALNINWEISQSLRLSYGKQGNTVLI
ncbi:hypothetical protein Gotur_006195 [Gossypium turneri]